MSSKINISVLFVEDEKMLRIIYQKILSRYIDVLYMAEDGMEGLELYERHKPDLVVSDIQLPRLNGIEMIERIRKNDEDTKVVIISAYSEADYFIEAIKLRVNGFLLKPVDSDRLLKQVRSLARVINLEKEYKVQERKRLEAEENLVKLNEVLEKRVEESIEYLKKEINERKRVEEELRRLNASLEQRVKEEVEAAEMQRQLLMQKSKLESIGELAAGMAHEINQPLLGISMGMDNILFKTHTEGLNKEYIEKKFNHIFNDIDRIKTIIEHVRIFSRDQELNYNEHVEVCTVIESALSLVNRQYENHRIKITKKFCDQSYFTLGNQFRLEQVFLNLFANSKSAVDKQEEVKLKEKQSYQKEILIGLRSEGDQIIVEIEDNGIGIDKKDLPHIFDPFYTTKEALQGTGLGLSITYGIVQDMNGDISVHSVPGKGTRVKISLPLEK